MVRGEGGGGGGKGNTPDGGGALKQSNQARWYCSQLRIRVVYLVDQIAPVVVFAGAPRRQLAVYIPISPVFFLFSYLANPVLYHERCAYAVREVLLQSGL